MHWPYGEEAVLERVLRCVRPRGGLALLTGIQPYEISLDRRHKVSPNPSPSPSPSPNPNPDP